jgi:LysM repeat protein
MKTNTTFPTKHPHWIDEPEYLEAINKRKRLGLSFTTAFVLVLAIHLAGAGGIFAFSNLKRAKNTSFTAKPRVEEQDGPKSDALARTEWPQPEAKPKVVATPASEKKQAASSKSAPKAEEKPAPVVAEKPKAKPALAKRTPKPTPEAVKADDSEMKKAFLATRSNPQPADETRQTIADSSHPQPVIASNTEVAPKHSIATPLPAPAPIADAKPSAPRPSEYTLAPGDNLYMVSRKLQVSYNDLMQANGLTDPRQLRVGQKLKVPSEHIASL